MQGHKIIFVVILPVIIACVSDLGENYKIFIDNDAGGDDAFAIFIALLNEKYCDGPKLIGLSTGNGNTDEDNVFINDQKVLHLAKRPDVPIHRGTKTALVINENVTDYYGKDGLGNNNLNFPPIQASDKGAIEALINLSKVHKEELIVISLKSLTNIAMVIKIDPGFISRIGHIYIGAGNIHSKQFPLPEFNAFMDVEAYHVVMKHTNPDKVTVLPFSQTRQTLNISKDWRVNVFGNIKTDVVEALNVFESVALTKQLQWESLDTALVAAVLQPNLISETRYSYNSIHLCGDKRGITNNAFVDQQHANVRIIYSMKKEPFQQYLLDLFSNAIAQK